MAAGARHPTSSIKTSSSPLKPLARPSKETPHAKGTPMKQDRSLGSPGSSPASADGTATISPPVQRPCGPAGTNWPQWPQATRLLWPNTMCESRSPCGEREQAATAARPCPAATSPSILHADHFVELRDHVLRSCAHPGDDPAHRFAVDRALLEVHPVCLLDEGGIARHRHEAVLQGACALGWQVGRGHHRQRHEEGRFRKLQNRLRFWIGGKLAARRYVRIVGKARGARKCD